MSRFEEVIGRMHEARMLLLDEGSGEGEVQAEIDELSNNVRDALKKAGIKPGRILRRRGYNQINVTAKGAKSAPSSPVVGLVARVMDPVVEMLKKKGGTMGKVATSAHRYVTLPSGVRVIGGGDRVGEVTIRISPPIRRR